MNPSQNTHSRNGHTHEASHADRSRTGHATGPAPRRIRASVTTAVQKREILRELQDNFNAMDASQSILAISPDGTILTANPNFLSLFGYTAEEIQGRHYSCLMGSAQATSNEFRDFWSEVAQRKAFSGTFRRRSRDGRELWIQSSFTRIENDQGTAVRILEVAVDCTEFRKLKDEVAELRVRSDITNMTSVVSESDLKGDILDINEKFIEVSKYSREELIGKPHNTTRHPDMSKEVFKELWATIGRGKTFRGVIKNRAKDGTPYYVDAVVAPVLGENGKPRKYIGVRYVITDIELERQAMRGLFSAIDNSFAYIEFDTKGQVLKANNIFLGLLGYRSEEVVGRHHRMFLDPSETSKPAYVEFWEQLAAGKSHNDVFRRITKNGSAVWIQAVYAAVKDETGRVYKVVKIATDVTAQKNAERKLQRTLATVNQNSGALGAASEELLANSKQMVSNSEETATQAGVVSAAAEQVSKNIQTVATATEEMGVSIKEIAKNAHDAASVATTAVKAAETANATVSKLGDSSTQIGKVIKVITSIAQQTNLLALNATIEAARAGEAGKGFAVVANEVKELAKETAKATEDISQKIEAIQNDTRGAVAAISEISSVINRINDFQNMIATAVEEQTATTNEINRNVIEAARGASEIAQNVIGVAEVAKGTLSGAADTQKASAELSRMAVELQTLVADAQG